MMPEQDTQMLNPMTLNAASQAKETLCMHERVLTQELMG
jgi:hypothetical protein